MKYKTTHQNLATAKLLAAFAVAALVTSANAATTIGISFTLDGDTAGGGGMNAGDLAGAPGVRVANWNNIQNNARTLSSAIYEDGTAVTGGFQVAVTLGNGPFEDVGSSTNDAEMFNGIIDVNSNTTATVTNIPFASYDVYAYRLDDGPNRVGSFTIGSTTYYARGGTGTPTTTGTGYVLSTDTTVGTSGSNAGWDQGNYVKFSGLSGASFTLGAAALNFGDTITRNKWAGFQIVQVPEPSSVALLGLFGGFALLRRRR